jgi:hypothetical protein
VNNVKATTIATDILARLALAHLDSSWFGGVMWHLFSTEIVKREKENQNNIQKKKKKS